ncbi:hypothetical protein SNEBB_004329 [Seison nebaliae]|nr:hypothetical protein SNEBB_004329 [Seison nebaliae]
MKFLLSIFFNLYLFSSVLSYHCISHDGIHTYFTGHAVDNIFQATCDLIYNPNKVQHEEELCYDHEWRHHSNERQPMVFKPLRKRRQKRKYLSFRNQHRPFVKTYNIPLFDSQVSHYIDPRYERRMEDHKFHFHSEFSMSYNA